MVLDFVTEKSFTTFKSMIEFYEKVIVTYTFYHDAHPIRLLTHLQHVCHCGGDEILYTVYLTYFYTVLNMLCLNI